MGTSEIAERIAGFGSWFHNLELAGVTTAPTHFLGDYPRVKYRRFASALPASLEGQTVLDIGCNAGFYSIEMKRRGAKRVVGIDSDKRYLAQARFAAETLGLEIEYQQLSVYEVDKLNEKFDLVIFMGVLYHLRHPLLALDLIHEHVTKDLFLFQSMQRGSLHLADWQTDYPFEETAIFEQPEFPRMFFIENRYSGDPTNWWVPNRACVEGMLRSAGFSILHHPEEEVYICQHNGSGGVHD